MGRSFLNIAKKELFVAWFFLIAA
ncbi:TPA_asm: QacE family quaternary ammonium compound efflux SMR transporter, partial [Campylobacter jejuni]|nr:QacE family quaternary ammonium compound efflux SMR transporter [Campylobacter jejuni]